MKRQLFKVIFLLALLLIEGLSLFGGFSLAYAASAHQLSMNGTCLQPPHNVDLTSLSDATLKAYGLPTHATINTNPKLWLKVLAHAQNRTCGSTPNQFKRTHGIRPYRTNASEHESGNWSGNAANAARGTYRYADITFNVPSISFSNSSAQVSIWAGVGGDASFSGNPVLVQSGVNTSIVNGKQYNESFYEVFPGFAEQNLPLSRLNVGDQVYAESNLNNSGYNYFFIENETIDSFNSIYNYGSFSDSAIGECILERPSVNNAPTPLLEVNPNAGNLRDTETLNSCEVGTNGGGNGVGNVAHFYYTMYGDSGDVLAYPGSIYGNGYNYLVYWKASS